MSWSGVCRSRMTACVSRCRSTACSETSVETEVGHPAEGPCEPQPVPAAVQRRDHLRSAVFKEARMAAARGDEVWASRQPTPLTKSAEMTTVDGRSQHQGELRGPRHLLPRGRHDFASRGRRHGHPPALIGGPKPGVWTSTGAPPPHGQISPRVRRSSRGRLPWCGWFGDPCWPSAGSARRLPPVHAVSGPQAGMSIRALSVALSRCLGSSEGWHVLGRSSIAGCCT